MKFDSRWFFWGALLLGLIIALSQMEPKHKPKHDRVDFSYLPKGGNFKINTSNGVLDSDSLKGKVIVLYFGYTHCPDLCPTSLTSISAAKAQFPKDRHSEIQGLLVSVDPKRDSIQKLKEYVEFFDSSFIGGTPLNERQISLFQDNFDLNFILETPKNSDQPYAVNHTSKIYLINKRGVLSHRFEHSVSVKKLVKHIGLLL